MSKLISAAEKYFIISDSKSCLRGLNWPCSEQIDTFWHFFWLVEGTLGIGWK